MVDVEQTAVVGVEVGANLRVDATGTLALLADITVTACHAVHVG